MTNDSIHQEHRGAAAMRVLSDEELPPMPDQDLFGATQMRAYARQVESTVLSKLRAQGPKAWMWETTLGPGVTASEAVAQQGRDAGVKVIELYQLPEGE